MLSPTKENLRLGGILLQQGIVTQDQIDIALTEKKKNNKPIGKILVSLGFVTEAVIRDITSGVTGEKSVELSTILPEADAISLIPKEIAARLRIVPLYYDKEVASLSIAMVDTLDLVTLDQLNTYLKGKLTIIPVLAAESEITKTIDQFYGFELSVGGILREIETGEIDYQSLEATSEEYSQPVVRLVDALLTDAVKHSASDIHLEPEERFVRFRYRIDGVLRQIRSLHKNYWPAIAVRVKGMAGLDIAETRAPQDGRMSLVLSGRNIDFRISSLPAIYGENIVLRILDRQKGLVNIKELGLSKSELNALLLMVARPTGIILVTGPTGNGKTTTLYSILDHLNTESVNIMTLEDPVEYPTNLLRQTSINETVRMDFANGIKTLMRQDPDIILVGEIRDQDTADMVFRASMTGHQVFSTLHTNSAFGVIPRLIDIGVTTETIAQNVIGIIAQRLIRKLCVHCKTAYEPSQIECTLLGLSTDEGVKINRAVGCKKCSQQGYRGRIAVMEILSINNDISDLISQQKSQRNMIDVAKENGFRPLLDVATERVLEGVTSLDEVSRVIDLTERWEK